MHFSLERQATGEEEPQRRGQPDVHEDEEQQSTRDGNYPARQSFPSQQEHLGHEHAVEQAAEPERFGEMAALVLRMKLRQIFNGTG